VEDYGCPTAEVTVMRAEKEETITIYKRKVSLNEAAGVAIVEVEKLEREKDFLKLEGVSKIE